MVLRGSGAGVRTATQPQGAQAHGARAKLASEEDYFNYTKMVTSDPPAAAPKLHYFKELLTLQLPDFALPSENFHPQLFLLYLH